MPGGMHEGHAEAIAAANEQMRKQLAFTRAHVADKDRLKTELAEQAKVIDALEARVRTAGGGQRVLARGQRHIARGGRKPS